MNNGFDFIISRSYTDWLRLAGLDAATPVAHYITDAHCTLHRTFQNGAQKCIFNASERARPSVRPNETERRRVKITSNHEEDQQDTRTKDHKCFFFFEIILFYCFGLYRSCVLHSIDGSSSSFCVLWLIFLFHWNSWRFNDFSLFRI